jgi:hypothetical protein
MVTLLLVTVIPEFAVETGADPDAKLGASDLPHAKVGRQPKRTPGIGER